MNRPVKLRKDLTYKNIFGKEKKVMSKGYYVDLEDILAKVSFRGDEYIIPIENVKLNIKKYEVLQRINKAISYIDNIPLEPIKPHHMRDVYDILRGVKDE